MVKDFGDVYGEHWDLVYGFLFRLCRNEYFAEELAQETFFQAMRAWGENYEKKYSNNYLNTWHCSRRIFVHCTSKND